MRFRRYLKIWKKSLALELSSDMAYKWNFIIKCIAMALVDLLGPLIAILIYNTSSGIPGWTFEEFIFFTGTFTLVFGLNHAFFVKFPIRVIENVRNGEFDQFLIKPFNPLLFLTFSAWDLDGFAEVAVGLFLIIWSGLKLSAVMTATGIFWYIVLILFGVLFHYSIMILISAISFLVVNSWGLFDLFWGASKFARYPLNIFGATTQFTMTFIFPMAISAHYPATAILHGVTALGLIKVILPVIGFFSFSLLLWNWAMKNYTSAGG
ncbi:hypothetical protein HN587_07735 [Candidatus Woesearchaeota archaeon]|jgi:ABC-2 type transport system permease protein|nr:hypothetical protein [Candidatus Woesearchaeota archaeon]